MIATRETTAEPWTYLPGTLSADRSAVTFSTTHLSLFGVLGIDLADVVATFKKDFIDGIDAGITATVPPPSCRNESAALADGYTVAHDSGDTVLFCFGIEGGQRVLKITNNRNYPLEVFPVNLNLTVRGAGRRSHGCCQCLGRCTRVAAWG